MKRIQVLLAVVLTIMMGAIGNAAAGGNFRLAIGYDPLTLDPIASSDNGSIWTQLLLYDTLIRPTADGKDLEPGIAESWTVSDDGLTLSFKLRDAKFADGSPVTAGDVEFSLKRAASEGSGWARFFRPLETFEIVNDRELIIKLSKPFTPAFNNLALFAGAILPKHLVEGKEEAFFQKPMGSGPFVLDSWEKGSKLVLKKNPHYWQAGKPAVDTAELHIVAEGNARVLRLEAGEVDAIIDMPLNQLDALAGKDGIKTGQTIPYRSDFVLMNTTKPPFDDERVRQALNYAVDKQGILEGVLYGAGDVAATAMPVMKYADPALEPYPLDIEKAKALLAEAGYAEGFSAGLLLNSSNADHRNVAVALQAMLAPLGVKLDIQSMEGGTHWETTKAGNYDMALSYATSDTIDPDQLIGFLAVNPERANAYHTEWKSDRVNELYEAERATVDGPERGAIFREMIQLLKEGAPYVFLYHPATTLAMRDNVEGFNVLATSNFRLEDVTLK
jgi:peptide/nickel transport system substrate-binding protein